MARGRNTGETMRLLRSLGVPLHPSCLIFVGISSVLLASIASASNAGLLRIIPALFLVSWLFKYAYTVLEHVADGATEPPVPSIDMLGPFEQRPLTQLTLCLIVYTLIQWLVPPWSAIAGALALASLPASVAVLGVTHRAIDAINPVALWHTVRGLAWCYLMIIVAIACYAAGIVVVVRLPVWNVVRVGLLEIELLSLFGLIGGAIYLRRRELGYEPRSSPERRAEKSERERVRLRSAMLDRVYGLIRGNNDQSAVIPLRSWLGALPADQLETDVRSTTTQVLQWDNKHGVTVIVRCLIAHSLREGNASLALETANAALTGLPQFCLDSEGDTVVLAEYSSSIGNRRLARALIDNYRVNGSSGPLGSAATAILNELES